MVGVWVTLLVYFVVEKLFLIKKWSKNYYSTWVIRGKKKMKNDKKWLETEWKKLSEHYCWKENSLLMIEITSVKWQE